MFTCALAESKHNSEINLIIGKERGKGKEGKKKKNVNFCI